MGRSRANPEHAANGGGGTPAEDGRRAAEGGPHAESAGSDLHLDLLPDGVPGGRGVRAALTDALRDAVRSGRLAPGTRLPPSRSLAVDLALARNTVADAYGELVAEGWLTARQGSGTRVARRTAPVESAPVTAPAAAPGRIARPAHSFLSGSPDVSSFPRAAWLAAARRALATAPSDAFGYGDPRGRPELRHALAGYLARARGVRVDAERVVLCSGFIHGLELMSEVLSAAGAREIAVESFGLRFHRDVIARAGLRMNPLTVDARGARTPDLAATAASAVLLTPAHQFPTGVPLVPERRAAALDWAVRTGGFVIEDDYDGEFRYDRQPIGALQGLDPEHVVYIGTVSKSLSPALRVGWMVLPRRLVEPVVAAKGYAERHLGVVDQLTLAELVDSGAYDRQVRVMRQRYRRRRDQLVAALAERAPHLRVSGIAAGLHAVLELPSAGAERAALRRARREGLVLEGLRGFRFAADGEDRGGRREEDHGDGRLVAEAGSGGEGDVAEGALVVGYGTPPDHTFTAAVDALCRALPAPPGAPRQG